MCPGRRVFSIEPDVLVPLAFQLWGTRQPDNAAGMENYVVMEIERYHYKHGYHYGAWNDVAGTSLQHTICEYNIPFSQGHGS